MIDFPTSPTNGQTVVTGSSTYTYNSTKGTWDLTTTTVVGPTGPSGPTGPTGVFAVAATTAPTAPSTGTTWFNSETGKNYIYYDSFWVQVESAGPVGLMGPTGPAGSDAITPFHPFFTI